MAFSSVNPFPITGYIGKSFFCDREYELMTLKKQVENNINTTLISLRRLGKSSLIHRLFEDLRVDNTCHCIYVDIYPTQNLKEFTENLSQAILQQIPEHKSFGKRFLDLLKGFHPVISYDPLTGAPEVSFGFTEMKTTEKTLTGIFQFLENEAQQAVVAIDEFQQVANYPEVNTEALLRSRIQNLQKTRFIFSGSNKHMMAEIFNSAKRPFFSSTQMMYLNPISQDAYYTFIKNKFEEGGKKIDDEAIGFILEWTRLHTYYTQVICNNTYALPLKNIRLEDVKQVCSNLLLSQQPPPRNPSRPILFPARNCFRICPASIRRNPPISMCWANSWILMICPCAGTAASRLSSWPLKSLSVRKNCLATCGSFPV